MTRSSSEARGCRRLGRPELCRLASERRAPGLAESPLPVLCPPLRGGFFIHLHPDFGHFRGIQMPAISLLPENVFLSSYLLSHIISPYFAT
jgi:hypothetical protein